MSKIERICGIDCITGSGKLTGNLGTVKVTNRQVIEPNEGVTVLYRIDGRGNHYASEEFEEWLEDSGFDGDAQELADTGELTNFHQDMTADGWQVEEYSCETSCGLVILGKFLENSEG